MCLYMYAYSWLFIYMCIVCIRHMASSFSLNSFSLQSMSPIGEHSSVLRLFSVYQIRLTRLPLLCAPPLFPAPLWPGHCRDWAIAGVCRPLSNRRKCRPCPHPVGTRPSLSTPPCVPPHLPCHDLVLAMTWLLPRVICRYVHRYRPGSP